MKIGKIIISISVTLVLVYALDRNWGQVPPIGKFLDPFHGFWQNGVKNDYETASLSMAGLKADVQVIYDSLLIPHIFATNDNDLYFTQGYVTAQNRLWQMEFQVLAAAGRLSEIVGAAAIDFDRRQRRLGMVDGAEHNLKSIEEDSLMLPVFNSYAAGVNAYVSSLDYEDYPIEYKLLNYQPEEWNNLKAALVQMNFSYTLNFADKDMEMTNAMKTFGKEWMDLLYPAREEVGSPIVSNEGKWKFNPITLDTLPPALPEELIQLPPASQKPRGIGSNNWVVSGIKTATGSPILCNDPHLSLSLPSLWFVIQLHTPEVNAMGGSLVGAPAVILGFNDSIAWGATNAQRDLVDWYKIQFRDASRNEYLSDGQWVPTQKKIEEIKVSHGKSFFDTVVYTHHGPVHYDKSFHGENEKNDFALRWISHDAAHPAKTFHLLNRARNFRAYMKALDSFLSPAQNIVFGSVSGDIAIRVQGKFPVRRKDEGRFILDGTKRSSEWHAFIPFDQNVMMKNPANGFLLSANQYPVDGTYPYYIQSGDFYEAYRNRRISTLLEQSSEITPTDMMAMQNDNYNLQAAESLPFMISALDSAKLTAEEITLLQKLKEWDFIHSVNSEQAIYYETWWNIFYFTLWDEMTKAPVSMTMPSEFTTIKLLKEQPGFSFIDIASTPQKETIQDLLKSTLQETLIRVGKWKEEHPGIPMEWSSYKDTYVRHLLRLAPFSVHARNGGNSGIINASSHSSGPSWRMIVSLEKTGVKAWGVYPGGQSGNPGSQYYDNMMTRWEEAKPFRLKFVQRPEQLSKVALYSMTLQPEQP